MNTLRQTKLILLIFLFIKFSHSETPSETFDLDPQCYGSPPTQSCYLVYRGSYSWFGAHARCHSQGLSLALGSSTAQFTTNLLGIWFYNAHRVWYNLSGPAYADGTLLSASQRVPVDTSGEGDCFKFSRNVLTRVNCKQVLTEVHFGCELREGIDYYLAGSTPLACPSEWQVQEFRDLDMALCTLQIPIYSLGGTNWDSAQAACISRGGRLFSVRNDLEALWLEQFVRSIQSGSGRYRDVFVDMHEHLYCTDGWCWANGRRNVSAIIPWHSGEPNNGGGPDECSQYKTAASTQAEQRGTRASLHTGLNNLPCSTNFGNVQFVLCRRDPDLPTAITPPYTTQITAANTATATTTTKVHTPTTHTSTFRQENTSMGRPTLCLQECPKPQLCIQSFNFLIILIAVFGWSLFAYSVLYIAFQNCKGRANIQKRTSTSNNVNNTSNNGVEGERINESSVLFFKELSSRVEERANALQNPNRAASGVASVLSIGGGDSINSTSFIDPSTAGQRLSFPTHTTSFSTFLTPASAQRNSRDAHQPQQPTTPLTIPVGNNGDVGERQSLQHSVPPLPESLATDSDEGDYRNSTFFKIPPADEQEYGNVIVGVTGPESEHESAENEYMNPYV